jgi:hypothetical protein
MMAGMAVFGIYKYLKAGDLDSIKIKDLLLMETKLNKKINELNEEILTILSTIENLFQKSTEVTTKSEEISIANRIKTINQKKDMKQNAVLQLEKELRVVTNILILKQNEKDLKESGAWNRIKKMKPEKIEKWLTTKKLEQTNRNELIDDIVTMTSGAMESIEYDDDLDEILETIHEVRKGTLEIKEASKKVANEKEGKKKEKKTENIDS